MSGHYKTTLQESLVMSYFHSFGRQFDGGAFEFKGIRPLFMLACYTVMAYRGTKQSHCYYY